MNKALVLLSGGQDATTCLAWALEKYDWVETIGFNYNQKHSIELECRNNILLLMGDRYENLGEDLILNIPILGEISETALSRDIEIKMNDNGLPNTFIPGRNILFFTLAAAVAYRKGIDTLVGGMCQTDYAGYPDCRYNSIKSIELALNLSAESCIKIETPLMFLSKKETWDLAESLGGKNLIELIVNESHTCYNGNHIDKHSWGYGCGQCPACILRKNGYNEYKGIK